MYCNKIKNLSKVDNVIKRLHYENKNTKPVYGMIHNWESLVSRAYKELIFNKKNERMKEKKTHEVNKMGKRS